MICIILLQAYQQLSSWGVSVGRKMLLEMLEEVGHEPKNRIMKWKTSVEEFYRDSVVRCEQIMAVDHDSNSQQHELTTDISDKVSEMEVNNASGGKEVDSLGNILDSSLVIEDISDQKKQLYQIVFDNLDFFFFAKHMTSQSQNKSIHWVNLLALLDRVTGDKKDNTKPLKSVYDLYNADFIPTEDHNHPYKNKEYLRYTFCIPVLYLYRKGTNRVYLKCSLKVQV